MSDAFFGAKTKEELFIELGGRPFSRGGETVYNFGMRPSRQEDTDAVTVAFDDSEDVVIKGDKVFLWEYAKKANGGKLPPYTCQITGACVWAGGTNALITRLAIEAVTCPEPEVFHIPFTLGCYGYSRYLNGWNSSGEGSSGDAFARAISELGFSEFGDPDAPKANVYESAYQYTQSIEMQYSAFRNCPQGIKDRSKKHKGKFTAIQSLDQAEKELRKLRPFSVAGNWGGRIQCSYEGEGENRILWNGEQADTWEHQQSCHGCWKHPEFGRIWYIMNNWYALRGGNLISVHGQPANGEPPGGYWVDDRMMQHQLNYQFGELRSFSDLQGFTDGKLDFSNI